MNNLRILALCILIIGLVTTACTCGGKETKFELTSGFGPGNIQAGKIGHAGTSWEGVHTLVVHFETTDEVTLRLTNPDGIETDVRHWDKEKIEYYESIGWQPGVSFRLSGGYEVPKAGLYTLTVEDSSGKRITTYSYEFSGVSLSVVSLSLTWERNGDYYTLARGNVDLTNNGDIPAWVSAVGIGIDGKSATVAPPRTNWGEPLFVGLADYQTAGSFSGIQLWLWDVNLGGISGGEKALSLEMRDGADNIICTYSCTVTPSEGLQRVLGP